MVGGVMALLSYSSMFYFTAITSSIYLLLVIFFISDTRTCIPAGRFTLKDLRSIPDDRPFMAFSILVFLVSVVYSQMYSPLSVYSKGFIGLSEPEIGMLFAINGIMVVAAQYPVTRLTDRYRLTLTMGLGVMLYALGFGLVAFSHSFLMLGICIFIVTLGELTYMPRRPPSLQTCPLRRTAAATRASAASRAPWASPSGRSWAGCSWTTCPAHTCGSSWGLRA